MKKLRFSYYDEKEFQEFLDRLPNKDAAKLITIIQNIEMYGLFIAERQKWTKKVDNNLYEIRSKRASNIQRAIYFQLQGNEYVITHGFTKKTQKTPVGEISLAKTRRAKYLSREDK